MRLRNYALFFAGTVVLVLAVGSVVWLVPPATDLAAALVIPPAKMEASGRLVEIVHVLEDFRSDHGSYPTEAEGLSRLLEPPPSGRAGPRYFPDRYITEPETLLDPWLRAYLYAVQNGSCEVSTLGRDGLLNGSGEDEDMRLPCIAPTEAMPD